MQKNSLEVQLGSAVLFTKANEQVFESVRDFPHPNILILGCGIGQRDFFPLLKLLFNNELSASITLIEKDKEKIRNLTQTLSLEYFESRDLNIDSDVVISNDRFKIEITISCDNAENYFDNNKSRSTNKYNIVIAYLFLHHLINWIEFTKALAQHYLSENAIFFIANHSFKEAYYIENILNGSEYWQRFHSERLKNNSIYFKRALNGSDNSAFDFLFSNLFIKECSWEFKSEEPLTFEINFNESNQCYLSPIKYGYSADTSDALEHYTFDYNPSILLYKYKFKGSNNGINELKEEYTIDAPSGYFGDFRVEQVKRYQHNEKVLLQKLINNSCLHKENEFVSVLFWDFEKTGTGIDFQKPLSLGFDTLINNTKGNKDYIKCNLSFHYAYYLWNDIENQKNKGNNSYFSLSDLIFDFVKIDSHWIFIKSENSFKIELLDSKDKNYLIFYIPCEQFLNTTFQFQCDLANITSIDFPNFDLLTLQELNDKLKGAIITEKSNNIEYSPFDENKISCLSDDIKSMFDIFFAQDFFKDLFSETEKLEIIQLLQSRLFRISFLLDKFDSLVYLTNTISKSSEKSKKSNGGLFFSDTLLPQILNNRDVSNKDKNNELTKRFSGKLHYIDEFSSINIIPLMNIKLEKLQKELRYTQTRSAINSILIDSYAHNISAHSLNFLQSLFNYRNENYLKKHYSIPHFGRLENLPLNTVSYSDFFTANAKNKIENGDFKKNEPDRTKFQDALKHYYALGISDNSNTVFDTTLLDYILYSNKLKNKEGKEIEASNLLQYNDGSGKLPMPLDYAIAPLLTYLRDKGAFWSGVIRNNEASPSRIVSMYDLLMEMFNNPLFIGSIMAAEEFFMVHVFVDVENGSNDINNRHLLTINIKEFVEAEMTLQQADKDKNKQNGAKKGYEGYGYLNDNYSNLNFVRLGKEHADLRKSLDEQTILLPGGDVGKHAFFTIVENTLRNAKHIVKEHRDAIKQNGLELHFQIREYNFKLRKKILAIIKNSELKTAIEQKLEDKTTIKSGLYKGKTKEEKLKGAIQKGEAELKKCLKITFGIKDTELYKKISTALIKDKELYLIGINLNYRDNTTGLLYTFTPPTPPVKSEDEQFNMITSVIKGSYKPILTDGHPRMGGSSQDKVCAAALFNKTFTSAEYPHSDVEGYYPWIAYNLYPDSPKPIKKNLIYNDELREKKSIDERRKYLETVSNNLTSTPRLDGNLRKLVTDEDATFHKKLYIKFFHIWKAKEVQVFQKTVEDEGDNGSKNFIDTIPRYKIAVVKDKDSKKALQKRAVVRILENGIPDCSFENLYKEWNEKWGTNKEVYFKNGENVYTLSDNMLLNKETNGTSSIKIDHDIGAGNADVCKLRTHGYFLKYFFKCSLGEVFDMPRAKTKKYELSADNNENKKERSRRQALYQELLETIHTQITIVDDRLFNLIDSYSFEGNDSKANYTNGVLAKALNLHIYNEDKIAFDTNGKRSSENNNTFIKLCDAIKERIKEQKTHFFIFHLSFIDNLIINKIHDINSYDSFIEKWFTNNDVELDENVVIGMATGRGRDDWRKKISDQHKPHCIHVPIESLQTAIQQGVLFKDDFDIKYNLCKVLLGS